MGRSEIPRTLTVPHRRLIALLEGLGLIVEVEAPFPPKFVDCYLPDLHVGLEADGPQHNAIKDKDRDAYLMAKYALPIYRLTDKQLSGSDDEMLRHLLLEVLFKVWKPTRTERRMVAWRAGAIGD